MTLQEFNGAVRTYIEEWRDAYADAGAGIAPGALFLTFDNSPDPDYASTSRWLDVNIQHLDSAYREVGRGSIRHLGTIALGVFVREGTGTLVGENIFTSLDQALSGHVFGGGAWCAAAARSGRAPDILGWSRAGMRVPFTVDENRI